jgi:hypothetical protein
MMASLVKRAVRQVRIELDPDVHELHRLDGALTRCEIRGNYVSDELIDAMQALVAAELYDVMNERFPND